MKFYFSDHRQVQAMSYIWSNPDVGRRYLENLLDERKRLAFHVHSLPICKNLLNQEIARISKVISNQDFNSFHGPQYCGRPHLLNIMPDVAALNLGHSDGNSSWNPLQLQGFVRPQGPPVDHRNTVAASPCTLLTKKVLRLDVPVDSYPNFNCVGKLLGRGGNTLKQIEALTGCRLFIRGRGSMKDRNKEECLRGRPGQEHLNEPLHVLIEAVAPANVIDAQLKQAQEITLEFLKPMSKSQDLYKRQQLRELAMVSSLFKENTSQPSSSASPCRSGAMKRATAACKGTM